MPMFRIMVFQVSHPPQRQIVFRHIVFFAGSRELVAFTQKAAQNRVGKRAKLAAADFGNAFHRFIDHGMRRIARVMQLVHRCQKQAFELRIVNRFLQHLTKHVFQTAQITLATVGNILQRAVFLRRQLRMRRADFRQDILKIAPFGNRGNAVSGQFLGEGHTHIFAF